MRSLGRAAREDSTYCVASVIANGNKLNAYKAFRMKTFETCLNITGQVALLLIFGNICFLIIHSFLSLRNTVS